MDGIQDHYNTYMAPTASAGRAGLCPLCRCSRHNVWNLCVTRAAGGDCKGAVLCARPGRPGCVRFQWSCTTSFDWQFGWMKANCVMADRLLEKNPACANHLVPTMLTDWLHGEWDLWRFKPSDRAGLRLWRLPQKPHLGQWHAVPRLWHQLSGQGTRTANLRKHAQESGDVLKAPTVGGLWMTAHRPSGMARRRSTMSAAEGRTFTSAVMQSAMSCSTSAGHCSGTRTWD